MNDIDHLARIADLERQCLHLREARDALVLDIRDADDALKGAGCAMRAARYAGSADGTEGGCGMSNFANLIEAVENIEGVGTPQSVSAIVMMAPKGWHIANYSDMRVALCGYFNSAISFQKAMLPGWWWTAGHCGLTAHASVGPDRAFVAEPILTQFDDGFNVDLTNPSHPAIALVAATLRALEASK